ELVKLVGVESVTLQAEGLTLDGFLEFITRTTGTEWDIRGERIVIYTNPELRAGHEARKKSRTRQQLAAVTVPEISFDQLDVVDAYRKVRRVATAAAGLGAVPMIDIPQAPSKPAKIRLKAKKISVLALFDLLAAASVTSVDWRIEGAKIVVFDEAQLRAEQRRRRIAESRRSDSADDPFGGGGAAAEPASRRQSRSESRGGRPFNTESYDHFGDNPFFSPLQVPLSTFSADVDTASYANIRRLIQDGRHVPVDAARIEELINYFPYAYDPPATGAAGKPIEGAPFASHIEIASAPWAPKHRLARIGLKGYEIDWGSRPPSNLVFLLDVSGSMQGADRLDLVKESIEMLVWRLDQRDLISIVVYSGASGLVLPPTSAADKEKVMGAIEALEAGGSTNGGEGIALAYKTARQHFHQGGNNRVILCTDGDFNVGTTDRASLVSMVEEESDNGTALTVLGFGGGNFNDAMLEDLSNTGDGNYAYIDSKKEARKVFVRGLSGTLLTIAQDVKLQVEFNPAKVGAYRLIGYENRLLEAQEFDDDSVDAGDIGAGHTVTALYEIVPRGLEAEILQAVAPLKYQTVKTEAANPQAADELMTLRLRYKEPGAERSQLLSFPVEDGGTNYDQASPDFRFAAAVASFGMILRQSDYRGGSNLPLVLELARDAMGDDPYRYRKKFVGLVERLKRDKDRADR
ncbi:MAG: vWA domain-containing protein, partial [Verrucomicrobiales bacterium]